MIYFDPDKPNKYAALKKELMPYDLIYCVRLNGPDVKWEKRKIGKGDGGYVLAFNNLLLEKENVEVLSYGIGDDPLGVSFEHSLANKEFGGGECVIHAYDGSIEKFPVDFEGVSFFKENLTTFNFKDHVSKLFNPMDYPFRVLKMDIEGGEYGWLTDENLEILDGFDQFTIEVHGLIEESPEGWVYNEETLAAKKDLNKKVDFFKKLNKHFNLFHIHGNNHAPRYVDFPDSLELTYVSKWVSDIVGISKQRCPDPNVDEPNYDGREEYILDYWI